MPSLPRHPATGEQLRDSALALLRTRRAELVRAAMIAALRHVLRTGQVTADDVRDVVPVPEGIGPKFFGCVFRDLAADGLIRRTGYRPSRRPVAHCRPLSVWGLADAAAAAARLAELLRAGPPN